MPYFEAINVHVDYQYSTAKLFKNYVDEVGKYQIVLADRKDSNMASEGERVVQKKAEELQCPFYLLGDMNRIGETVILNVSLYETKSGNRIWGDRLKAAGPEDLDPIFQKIARAVGTQNKAAADGDIYSVTDYESQELKQVKVRNSFGLAIGGALFTPGILYGKSWDEPFSGGFGVFWGYDARTILFEVNAETYPMANNSHITGLSLSAFKPFSTKSFTLFGGGGLGIGMASSVYQGQHCDGSGLLFEGGGGIIFNRTSTVQLRLQGKYIVGAFEMGSPRNDVPRALILRMELAFGK